MTADIEKANESEIRKYLQPYAQDIIIEIVDTIDSTNDELRRRALNDQKEITLLIAEHQTKGKGSKGRSFFSPDGTGCYMSFLLRPAYPAAECTLLTTMASAVTAQAIEKITGKKAQIKWVNDIYIDRRKVAGILTQAGFAKDGKTISYAIVGIGINICEPEGGFPNEIENIAAAVSSRDTKIKNRLIGEIASGLVYYYKSLSDREYMSEYRKRLFFLGEEIIVTSADGTYKATAKDIDDMCHLIVETEKGKIKTLFGGEISIKTAKNPTE